VDPARNTNVSHRLEPYLKIEVEEIPSVSILNADSQDMVKAKEALNV